MELDTIFGAKLSLWQLIGANICWLSISTLETEVEKERQRKGYTHMSSQSLDNNKKLELRREWVAALKSGKYTQIQYGLRSKKENDFGYCCLGVLCNIVDVYLFDLFDASGEMSNKDGNISQICDFVGLNSETKDYLIKMNDNEVPFKKIAEYIESLGDVIQDT